VEARELVARGLQLHGGGVGRQVTDVRPVDDLDGPAHARDAGGREPAPQSLKAHVRAGHAQVAAGVDELHVVDAHDALAVHVDELLVQHVSRQQHLALAPREGAQVKHVGAETRAVLVDGAQARARQKEVAAAVARDHARHRRVVFAETHDHVLERRHPLALHVADGPAQYLREIEHQRIFAPVCLAEGG
jgi:hypothetical protein